MTFSIAPIASPDLWPQASTLNGSSTQSPEEQVDQLECEADGQAQQVPEARRAAYRTMIRREIASLRALITQLRADGFETNAINGSIGGLTQRFYESKNRFLEENEQFATNRALVCGRNQATADKIRQCTPDFSTIQRMPVDDDAYSKRPSFSKAMNAYDKVKQLDQLKEVAGGKLKQNFDGKSFINGCASRISYVLEQTGCKIPVIPGQTVSGEHGEQYIYRLTALEKFMRKAFGPPDCEWRKGSVIGSSDTEKCTYLSGRKGILIERWEPSPYTTCTGHAQIVNGEEWTTYHPPSDGVFWELPNDEQY